MKRKLNFYFLLIALTMYGFSYTQAQQSTVTKKGYDLTGTVSDPTGEPIVGANVVVKGETIGTITDIQGNFRLQVNASTVLTVSYIGFVSQNISINGKTALKIKLTEDAKMLDDIVIVGFGTQKKVNLTGAVGMVTAKELQARPIQNAVQALQGKVPGLNISMAGNGGELNATNSINIRGTGTIGQGSSGNPLVLIDGMEGNMSALNPQDIESVSVLKDAAASSIYGSRAPFGVILVTTKKGKAGRTTVNYNNSLRWSNPVKVPQMQNSVEFTRYFNDASINGSGNPLFDNTQVGRVNDYFNGILAATDVMPAHPTNGKWNYDLPNANVNWMNEYYRQWAPSQEHAASISGGNANWKYYASVNSLDQEGLMRYGTDKFSRLSTTVSLTGQLNKYVSVDLNSRFIRTNYNRATAMDGGFYLNVLRRARPTRPINDPNGLGAGDINYINQLQNGGMRTEENDWLYQQARITITPIKNWNIRAEFNSRTNTGFNHEDTKLTYAYNVDGVTPYRSALSLTNDYVYELGFKSNFVNPNIYTDYELNIDKHNFKLMAGFQSELYKQQLFSAKRNDMITTAIAELDKTTSATTELSGNRSDWATAGFFGRINYDYAAKYLLELNLRYDGTSRFRDEQRWGFFPSVSVGWNVANEAFWESMSQTIGQLKLRASYGELGNQNTNSWYPTYQTIPTSTAAGTWLVNGVKPNTADAPNLISSSLTWERVQSWNAGVDLGAFKNRLTASFDYYNRYTLNMVGPAPTLPVILGTSVPSINNTDLKTFGFELSLGWRDVVNGFSYGVQATLADSRTRILSYPNETNSIDAYRMNVVTDDIWGYETVGMAKTDDEMTAHLATMTNGAQNAIGSNWKAGDIMYADLNGDGKISAGARTMADHGDLMVIGNKKPRFMYGLNLDFAWKGIDLSMFWQGVGKRDYMPDTNNMVFWGATGDQWWSTALAEHLDYFRNDETNPLGVNTDAYYPRPLIGGAYGDKNHKYQTRYVQDASYLRLKNLQIGYTLPANISKYIGSTNLRIFLSGENLLTFTKLSSTLDPESIGIGGNGSSSSVGTVYPLSTVYSCGLSINF